LGIAAALTPLHELIRTTYLSNSIRKGAQILGTELAVQIR
jgi:hypothetical protein